MKNEEFIGNRRFGRKFFRFVVSYFYEVLIFISLFATLAVKLVHAYRYHFIGDYPDFILSDITFLLVADVVLAIVCYRGRQIWLLRICTVISALICTWAFLNAGWILRTGTQILPRVLLPLFWSTGDALHIIGVNLVAMPFTAVVLLLPAFILISILIYVLTKPELPKYNRRIFIIRMLLLVSVSIFTALVRPAFLKSGSTQAAQIGLRFSAHIRAITSLAVREQTKPIETDRKIPSSDEVDFSVVASDQYRKNVIIIVLEGVQYNYTSLSGDPNNLTPNLLDIAEDGVQFENARSTLTHTTKALFALLTGRFPSASQDVAETVPVEKPFASLATVLEEELGYRTAFFQSAKGSFEGRPGLVHNLGFDKFWSREQINDPNYYVGSLGCDEFKMLEPVKDWIKQSDEPFLLTLLCSVTHDPYEVPYWYNTEDQEFKEPIERYKQTVVYTDAFLKALDDEINSLNLEDNTILCIISDHGEAFGEHGMLGHERIAFDEVLHVPFCIRAPGLISPRTEIKNPVSSVDLAPTLLSLLGVKIQSADFDGIDVLHNTASDRKTFFTTWMQEGPAGYVQNGRKYVYDMMQKSVYAYDIVNDPHELVKIDVPVNQAEIISEQIIKWRENTVFSISQSENGSKTLYEDWFCKWADRNSVVRFQ